MSKSDNNPTAEFYDKVYEPIKGADIVAQEVDLIKQNIKAGGKILDIGCGTGRHLLELAEMGYQVTGIDVADAMLDVLKNKKVDADVINADFLKHDFAEHSFDGAIAMWNTINEVAKSESEIAQFFEKLKNILTKEGRVILNFDDPKTFNTEKFDYTVVSEFEGLKYVMDWKVLEFNKATNTSLSEEKIRVFDKEKLIREVKTNIEQRWWMVNEIETAAEKYGFGFEEEGIEKNDEVYLVLKLARAALNYTSK